MSSTLEFTAAMVEAIRRDLAEQLAAKEAGARGEPVPAKPSAHALRQRRYRERLKASRRDAAGNGDAGERP